MSQIKPTFLAATQNSIGLVACTLLGEVQPLQTEPDDTGIYVTTLTSTFLDLRIGGHKSCTVAMIPMVDADTFRLLCAHLQRNCNDTRYLTVLRRPCHVEGSYDGQHMQLSYGPSGREPQSRWRCTSGACHARNHYRCEHVRFAQQVVPVEAILPSSLPEEDYSDLIDE